MEKMKLNEIKAICKKYNVKSTGTKTVLLKRIEKAQFLERWVNKNKSFNDVNVKHYKDDIYRSLQSVQFHNLVSKEFSGEIIGKMNTINDSFHSLTKKDIELCKEQRLKFTIPIILEGEHVTDYDRSIIEEDEDDDEDLEE